MNRRAIWERAEKMATDRRIFNLPSGEQRSKSEEIIAELGNPHFLIWNDAWKAIADSSGNPQGEVKNPDHGFTYSEK